MLTTVYRLPLKVPQILFLNQSACLGLNRRWITKFWNPLITQTVEYWVILGKQHKYVRPSVLPLTVTRWAPGNVARRVVSGGSSQGLWISRMLLNRVWRKWWWTSNRPPWCIGFIGLHVLTCIFQWWIIMVHCVRQVCCPHHNLHEWWRFLKPREM